MVSGLIIVTCFLRVATLWWLFPLELLRWFLVLPYHCHSNTVFCVDRATGEVQIVKTLYIFIYVLATDETRTTWLLQQIQNISVPIGQMGNSMGLFVLWLALSSLWDKLSLQNWLVSILDPFLQAVTMISSQWLTHCSPWSSLYIR